ncbi:hypothetical protein V8G54_034203 [Vigna mungo]|uniref:Uncharacterized protein n=1 Tax=Vigna mungo TaxID=3915 RepID=A0AAQ3MQD7_VIGMU
MELDVQNTMSFFSLNLLFLSTSVDIDNQSTNLYEPRLSMEDGGYSRTPKFHHINKPLQSRVPPSRTSLYKKQCHSAIEAVLGYLTTLLQKGHLRSSRTAPQVMYRLQLGNKL